MAFWQMSTLSSRRGRDVDGGVGDDQDLVVGRHVHDEDVADAAARAQAGLARHDRAQQLVGVQAALHQQLGLALRGPAPPPCAAAAAAVRRVDDLACRRGRCPPACAISSIFARRADEDRRRSGPARRPRSAPASADSSQGYATAVGIGARLLHRSSSRSYFPVPVLGSWILLAGDRRPAARAAGPVSFRKKVRTMASATPYRSGSNVVW